jgi:hypothetical protein
MDVKFLQFMRDFVAKPTGGEGKNAGGASSESPNTKISISPESENFAEKYARERDAAAMVIVAENMNRRYRRPVIVGGS